jgi:hypothetical protein
VLEDQQVAGALMWTCVTVIYFVVGTIFITQLLTSGSFSRESLRPVGRDSALPTSDPSNLEIAQ